MMKAGALLFLHLLAAGFITQYQIQSGTEVALTLAGRVITGPVAVLFATNEDCELYINGESQGLLLKKELRYINLTPGQYKYVARSRSTGDELTDTISITEGGTNEFFLDLLYLVDQKSAERQRLKALQTVSNQTAVKNTQPKLVKTEAKLIGSQDAELQTVYSLTANMVAVKGGSFAMGNSRSPFPDEAEHRVNVSPLLFSRYEVTQYQWQTIMGDKPSLNSECATCPVENVSWEEVMRFIRKLNAVSRKNFRLPTEAEWEYVARIGGKLEIDTAGGQEQYIKKTAWYAGNANKKTQPVGIRQPNAAGIFDLTGNVSEWCYDWYGAYGSKEGNLVNPAGPPAGVERVIRGGNYKDYAGDRFRPSIRSRKKPLEKSSEVGFRLVLDTVN